MTRPIRPAYAVASLEGYQPLIISAFALGEIADAAVDRVRMLGFDHPNLVAEHRALCQVYDWCRAERQRMLYPR